MTGPKCQKISPMLGLDVRVIHTLYLFIQTQTSAHDKLNHNIFCLYYILTLFVHYHEYSWIEHIYRINTKFPSKQLIKITESVGFDISTRNKSITFGRKVDQSIHKLWLYELVFIAH